MRKTVVALTVTALLVIGLVGVVTAAGPRGSRWLDQEGKPPILQLNLTEEQLAQIRERQADMYQSTRDLRISQMDKTFELRQLYLAAEPDEDAIAAKRAELEQLREKMLQIREANKNCLDDILTEEQQEQLSEMRGMGRSRHGRWGSPKNIKGE